jgi:hypothetical protein
MKRRSWTNKHLIDAVNTSTSIRQVISKLGLVPAGGNYQQVHQYISELNLKTTHFTGKAWNRGKTGLGKPKYKIEELLIKGGLFQSYKLKKRLIAEGIKKPCCEECGWSESTPEGYLPLELDHINGDHSDNRIENLRILCPNCHSLKPTHRGRNRKGRVISTTF